MSTNLYERTDLEITKLEDILKCPSTTGQYKQHCGSVLSDLKNIQTTLKSFNPFDAENLSKFKEQLKSSVSGRVGLTEVQLQVDKETVKQSCFPFYVRKNKVKGYYVTKCTCNLCGPLIYPRFVAAHGQFPNNDQVPLYFIQQLYAEVHLGLDVNYLDLPDYYGQGKGRLRDRELYRQEGVARVVDLRQVVDRPQPFVTGFHDVAMPLIERAQQGAIEGIANIARHTQLISTQVGDFLQRRDDDNDSNNNVDDSDCYIHAHLVSPRDVDDLMDDVQLRRVSKILASDLLLAYKIISDAHGIPLENVVDFMEEYRVTQNGSSINHEQSVPVSRSKLDLSASTSAPDVHLSCEAKQATQLPLFTFPDVGKTKLDSHPVQNIISVSDLLSNDLPSSMPTRGSIDMSVTLFSDTLGQGVQGIEGKVQTFSTEGSTDQRSTESVSWPHDIEVGSDRNDRESKDFLKRGHDHMEGSESFPTTRR